MRFLGLAFRKMLINEFHHFVEYFRPILWCDFWILRFLDLSAPCMKNNISNYFWLIHFWHLVSKEKKLLLSLKQLSYLSKNFLKFVCILSSELRANLVTRIFIILMFHKHSFVIFYRKKITTPLLFVQVSSRLRSSDRRCSVKKGVLRNFAKFTGKYLCQRLFFNKVAGLGLQLY